MDELNVNTVNEVQESVVDSQPETTETVNEQVIDTSVNKVEAAEQPLEKPTQDAETNAKYAEMRRNTESETKDKMIDEMYGESHGIHTYSEYQEAIKAQQEQEKIKELIEKNVPEEYAKDMVENKRFRDEYEQKETERQQQEYQENNYREFIEAFPDVKAEEIPAEVWTEVDKGKSLTDAYSRHEVTALRNELAQYKKGSKTQELNQANAQLSTGILTFNLKINDGHIDFDTFEANKKDQSWVMKNYNKIMESRQKW